ncbi:MAG: response regulator [Chloroflexi bacterium]|nr:response regulator [Chloroflexota bacterium]
MTDAAREAVAFRVAVIEDDSVVRIELTRSLEDSGYRVIAVADGENGLRAVHEHQPDLLLLSLAVPRLDAFELVRRLRLDHRTTRMPVLALTERTGSDHRIHALDAGADDVILKPYHPDELLARVRSALRTRLRGPRMEPAHAAVIALSNAVEAKDVDLKDHCRYMAYRAARLAAHVGMRGHDLDSVAHGALLHDVGKIAIPLPLLHKVEPLSADEWRQLRRHPDIGARICGPLDVARDIAPIIRHHHERWDGSGYPDGLGSEEIPLGARIVALADAYDVMVRGRPYQAPRSHAAAIAELRRCAGSQFDPALVPLFIEETERVEAGVPAAVPMPPAALLGRELALIPVEADDDADQLTRVIDAWAGGAA